MGTNTGTTGTTRRARTADTPGAADTSPLENYGSGTSASTGSDSSSSSSDRSMSETYQSSDRSPSEMYQQNAGTTSQPTTGTTAGRTQDFSRMVREAASSQLTSQKGRATRGLGAVADAVRSTTDTLRNKGQGGVADYLQQAAEGIDGFAHRLEAKDLDEVVEDVQAFARRNPALFIAAAFGVGLLVSRFMRASSDRSRQFAPSEYKEWS